MEETRGVFIFFPDVSSRPGGEVPRCPPAASRVSRRRLGFRDAVRRRGSCGHLKRDLIDATAIAISGVISRTVTSPLDKVGGKKKGGTSMRWICPRRHSALRANSNVMEPEIQKPWEDNQVSERVADRNSGGTLVLHDGPLYANENLHMGHALNKILKDIISRYKVQLEPTTSWVLLQRGLCKPSKYTGMVHETRTLFCEGGLWVHPLLVKIYQKCHLLIL